MQTPGEIEAAETVEGSIGEGRHRRITSIGLLVLSLVCAPTTALPGVPQDPVPQVKPEAQPREEPAPSPEKPRPIYEVRYHTLEEVGALLRDWTGDAGLKGLLMQPIDLPPTRLGLTVPALELGRAGPLPLAERPVIFLIGGLDGVSLSGCEAVLAVLDALVHGAGAPSADLAYIAIPCASPDALQETLAGRAVDGRNQRPLDDDGDLLLDEDGPDDVDGDGLVLDMLLEDPSGPWTRALDPRFLAPARDGDAPRYRLVREGRDDDQDGRYNEDPIGGVDLDLSFPLGFDTPRGLSSGSPLPLDEPPGRALADLAISRRTTCVLLFQGNHGMIAGPGSRRVNAWASDTDASVEELVTRIFAHATGRAQPHALRLYEARGEERPGAALDWYHAVAGALAFEIAAWGPAVEKPLEAKGPESKGVGFADAGFESSTAAPDPSTAAPIVPAVDRAWSGWLDNTRGGIGFTEWHPVELGDGRSALVGGWEPFSRLNPPAKTLPVALQGIPQCVEKLSSSLPVLDLHVVETRREGEVCTLRVRVENKGTLPAGTIRSAAASARIEIVLPTGARLLAGESSANLGLLGTGCASREVAWILLAAPNSVLTLRATAPWAAPIVREVRP